MEAVQGMEELRLIAELGVALAGLIAIFLVLIGRNGRFSAAESFHVRSMLAAGTWVAVMALLPLVLHLYIDNEPAVWRTASGISLGSGLLVCAGFARLQLSMPKGERWGLSLTSTLGVWALVSSSVALVAANFAGLAGGPAAPHYVAALVGLISSALLNFLTIALRRIL